MSSGSNQECPHPAWYFNGETSAPPAQAHQYVSSPRNSPYPWGGAAPVHNYPFANTMTNNLDPVGPPPPPQGNGHNVHATSSSYFRPLLSSILKRILSDRIAHADSEVVSFRRETCGPGRSRVTVTFETSDGI